MLMLCPPNPNEFFSMNLSLFDLIFIACLAVMLISIAGSTGSALTVFGSTPSCMA